MDHKLHNEHLFYRKNLELQNSKNTHLSDLNNKIGVDPSGEPSLTALVRNQKDTIDNKLSQISAFLDKDNSQFHLKHHPPDHHVMLAGNTNSDGSGTKNHAHVDSNGVLRVSQVSSQNIQPSNSANSRHASNNQSFSVGVGCRTNINDETTHVHLLSDAQGHQQIDIVNQPNVKVEDLSSSLNAQHVSGTSRSLAVGIKGTTDISDVVNGSTFLKCDSRGRLETNINREAQQITTDSSGANLSGSLGNGVSSASCDLLNFKHIHFLISGSTNLAVFTVEGSHDNSTFYPVSDIAGTAVGGVTVHLHKIREATYRYYRITNSQGMGSFTFSNVIFTKLNL